MTADVAPLPDRQHLPSRWAVATIDDLLRSGVITAHKDGNHGSNYPRAAEFGDKGIPFLTAKLLDDGHIDIYNAPRLPEKKADRLRIGFVQPGDVLLSHNATIGRVAVVPAYTGRLMVGTSLTYFRLDKNRLIPNYLAAFFRGVYFQNQLKAFMSHSTRNQVPITAQRNLRIVVPPVEEQLAITSILDALNDRIDTLRATNATLEAIAQALFKSWFVDFDPVHAKAEGRAPAGMDAATAALFPSEFEQSELGTIPKGWRVRPLADMLRVEIGGAWGHDAESDKSSVCVSCLRGIDAVEIGVGRMPSVPTRWLSSKQLASRSLAEGDIVVEGSGSFCGRSLCWIDVYRQLTRFTPTYSNFVKRLASPLGACVSFWASHHLQCIYSCGDIANYRTGSAFPNLDLAGLLSCEVATPPLDCALFDAFYRLCRQFLETRTENVVCAQTLADLRDTLLPRLISGKLRIPKTTKATEATLG